MMIPCTKCGKMFEKEIVTNIVNLCPECKKPLDIMDMFSDIFKDK